MNIKNNKLIIILLFVFGIIFTIIGATFAYFSASASVGGNSINGSSYAFNMNLDVSPVRSGNLIPVADDLIDDTLNSNYICEDARGYGLCSLYQITFTNSSGPQDLIGSLKTIGSTYTTSNLKYQLFTLNGSTYSAISTAEAIDHNTDAINPFKLNGDDVIISLADGTSSSTTKDVYLAIWISDPGVNQLEDQDKVYTGVLVFDSTDGDAISSVFITTDNGLVVTFDANGGTTNISNKMVVNGSIYGKLPTPTREGYAFKGWHGKNLINDEEIRNYVNWKRDIVTTGGYPTSDGNPGFLLNLETGKTYTISITLAGTTQNEIPPYLYLCKVVNNAGYLETYLTTTHIERLNYSFTVAEGETYFLRMGGTATETQFNTNIGRLITIQLEENNIVTPYEPYYVTNRTIVAQNQNHTLTAIWEAKTITVNFDANGGTVNTSTKTVIYGENYGTLPTPTRNGYTFLGWHGENIFNPRKMTLSNTTFDTETEEVTFNNGVWDRIMDKTQWIPQTSSTYTIVMQITQNTFDNSVQLLTDERFYIEKFNNKIVVPATTVQKYISSFTTRSDYSNVTLGSLWFNTSKSVTGTFKTKLAIYKGTNLVSWEPYYITSNTTVVQDKNHTLKAMWQKNS